MNRKQVTDWLVYLIVRIVICGIQTMRLDSCQALSRTLARVMTDILRLRQAVVDDNLRHVFPELSANDRRELTRKMWEHLFLMVCEIAHAPRKIHRTNWQNFISIHRKREIVASLLDERPTLLVSGHFGNFELGGFVTGLLGFPSYTVARTLDNLYLDEYVNRFRSANGQFIIPKDGSAHQIDAVLAEGAALTLLGDQHAGKKGCWVDFFGRPASCHKAIALFAMTSRAPLLVAYTRRLSRPMHFEIGLADAYDPAQGDPDLYGVVPLTQWYNRALERVVRNSPDQYWWLHRRWKDPPKRLRKKATQADEVATKRAA